MVRSIALSERDSVDSHVHGSESNITRVRIAKREVASVSPPIEWITSLVSNIHVKDEEGCPFI